MRETKEKRGIVAFGAAVSNYIKRLVRWLFVPFWILVIPLATWEQTRPERNVIAMQLGEIIRELSRQTKGLWKGLLIRATNTKFRYEDDMIQETKKIKFSDYLPEALKDMGAESSLSGMLGWQPIETAPKEGVVLLYIPQMDNVVSGMRSANGGWCDCWCSGMRGPYEPSHWMELPEPPTE